VRDCDGDRVGPGLLDDALNACANTPAERLERLGARDDVPSLLLEDARDQRIALRDTDAKLPALPLPEADLRELVDDCRLEPGRLRERSRGLLCATKRGHEQPLDLLAREPAGERIRLLVAGVGERGVGPPVDEGKRRTGVRGFRRAVTDEDDLRRALRQRERPLLGGASLLRYLGAGQGSTSTLIDSFFRSCVENASAILANGSRCVIRGST
jgi:hypothetical protein